MNAPHEDRVDAEAVRAAGDAFALERALRASPEWQVVVRMDTFGRSVRLLESNAQELGRALHYLTREKRSLLLDEREMKQWLEEVGRRLHNAVAAVMTLVDHTRAFHRQYYKPTGMFADYPGRGSALGENPLIRFVQNLRNYFLHLRLPSVDFIEDLDGNRKIALRKNELLTFDTWEPPARAFLQGSPEDIDIDVVIDQYLTSIREFYGWFGTRLQEIHAAEYAPSTRDAR